MTSGDDLEVMFRLLFLISYHYDMLIFVDNLFIFSICTFFFSSESAKKAFAKKGIVLSILIIMIKTVMEKLSFDTANHESKNDKM